MVEQKTQTPPDRPLERAQQLIDRGEYQQALRIFATILRSSPEQPHVWIYYGHMLKTVGRTDDAVTAYRQAVALRPVFGRAWWAISNLKTVRFEDSEVEAMLAALERASNDDDRLHIRFALGNALDERGDHATAFDHFAVANAMRRTSLPYDVRVLERQVERSKQLFTKRFFRDRQKWGSRSQAPIFIVGMPRSGSTLVEQILGSHPEIEATAELTALPDIAAAFAGDYPKPLARLLAADIASIGEDYLQRTQARRRTGRPRFVDKQPNNWQHIGLIHVALPRAVIIDVRRHPLDCGLSNFMQNFVAGGLFSYTLEDIGRYQSAYLDLMGHYDAALPGRIHRVELEQLVSDPEGEVRRLLDHIGLPFDEACLHFHESDRAVFTPSASQVRRPLNDEGIGRWRHYEQWLGPLRAALKGS